jgi:hypothetical protein
LSVLFRFTDFDYPFGIFKSFHYSATIYLQQFCVNIIGLIVNLYISGEYRSSDQLWVTDDADQNSI